MIALANVFENHGAKTLETFGEILRPECFTAMRRIQECRTAASGELHYSCPACGAERQVYQSCGHRSCPRCQNHLTTEWLEKQKAKLLPVKYFMVTFTIPAELHVIAMRHGRQFYDMMFKASAEAMKQLAANKKHLGGEIGFTGVFHSNSRRLNYHPHIHYIVPSGAICENGRVWKEKKGKYLMPAKVLSLLFRGKLIALMKEKEMEIPVDLYKKDWVIDVKNTGTGQPGLEYLSRYLYRGVISEKRILKDENGEVTFRYTDSGSKKEETRTLSGETFLYLVLKHVLPKGFRRCRDYGFLHGNSKKKLNLLQLMLNVVITGSEEKVKRPTCKCKSCKKEMVLKAIIPRESGVFISIRAGP